jgi:hypothetical protein
MLYPPSTQLIDIYDPPRPSPRPRPRIVRFWPRRPIDAIARLG